MTDSIKTSLSLAKLAELVRMDIPANICTVSTPWGENTGRYTKPSRQKSPLADTHTKWVVRCELGTGNLADYSVPSQIDADLNIPNAITGQNVEHGTSVFAAGIAALELQRRWLADCGLPREQLDLITTSDVKLNGTTITYLMPFNTKDAAIHLVKAIEATGRVLNKRCTSWESTNETIMLPGRDFTMIAYIKTDLSHCKFKNGAPVRSIIEQGSYIVRIEAKLGLPFLRKLGRVELESWRNAYLDGVYETIFNETVRKSLSLAGTRLRHKAPREEVFGLLTETEATVLRGYLAEPPLDPRQAKTVTESSSPNQRFYEIRKPILRLAKIDIDIPWKEHVKLRCFELADKLIYPGDYNPADDRACWCFCKANWANLLEQLRQSYEIALAAAARRKRESDIGADVAA